MYTSHSVTFVCCCEFHKLNSMNSSSSSSSFSDEEGNGTLCIAQRHRQKRSRTTGNARFHKTKMERELNEWKRERERNKQFVWSVPCLAFNDNSITTMAFRIPTSLRSSPNMFVRSITYQWQAATYSEHIFFVSRSSSPVPNYDWCEWVTEAKWWMKIQKKNKNTKSRNYFVPAVAIVSNVRVAVGNV